MSARVQPKDVDKVLIALCIMAKNQEQLNARLNGMREYLFIPWNAAQP